ncbi:MAG TPA: hypothetical protein VF618_10945 [Thermoanaerobaculia bacterium]
MIFECPLCSLEFEDAMCHSACPMGKGCAMVRCPRCQYEFVQDGSVSGWFKKLFSKKRRPEQHA